MGGRGERPWCVMFLISLRNAGGPRQGPGVPHVWPTPKLRAPVGQFFADGVERWGGRREEPREP